MKSLTTAVILHLALLGAAIAQDALCDEYCRETMEACQGETQIYADEAECQAACAQIPQDGPEGAIAGDNIQCRIEHAILAKGEEGPVKHCPHAAPGGGGVCIDRSPCEAYCLFYFDRVVEEKCPLVDGWGEDFGSVEQGTGDYTISQACLDTCQAFPGAGAPGETSGNSANCRAYYYLIANRETDPDKRAALCQQAHPTQSTMCVGETFDELYTRTAPDVCREVCHHDQFSCDSQWGSEAECMAACAGWEAGERGAMIGPTAHCRLSYLLNATLTTTDPMTKQLLCRFGGPESIACEIGGEACEIGRVHDHGSAHRHVRCPDPRPTPRAEDDGGCVAAPGAPEGPGAAWALLALLAGFARRRR